MFNSQTSWLQSTVLAASLLLGQAHAGFFRVNCQAILHGRVDPLVNPGAVAGHVHKISGGYNIGLNSDYDDMIASKCTSCEVTADKSAYWTPQLYYQYPNGTFVFVPSGGHLVYYLGRGQNLTGVQPFPPGFKMLSGNSAARSYDANTKTWNGGRPISDRVSFACLDGSNNYAATPNLLHTSCKDGMRAQIHFQSCWDGVNLYKTDNSHVAYLSQIDNGACPSTHPVPLIHLFFEVYYRVNEVQKVTGGKFVFANGDSTGYGFHGDFLNGWDPKVQQAAIDQCIIGDNDSGQVSTCNPLAAVQSTTYGQTCPERSPLIDEQVKGLLSDLPGCNPVTGDSSAQTLRKRGCNSPTPNVFNFQQSTVADTPTLPAVGSTLNGWQYAGSVAEPSGARALSATSQSGAGVSVQSCQTYCASKGYSLAGLEYGRECWCDNTLKNGATFNTAAVSTNSAMVCSGNSTQFCGGSSLLFVYKRLAISRAAVASASSSSSSSSSTAASVKSS